MTVLARLRPVTAAVLALAFVAGPVSAACLHGLDHGATHEAMDEMPAHEMPGHDMPMGDMAGDEPCHDEPPAPQPMADDCDAPCCTAEPVAEAPVLPAADALVVLAVVASDVWAAPTPAPVALPEAPPPPLRRHVELQRFLI